MTLNDIILKIIIRYVLYHHFDRHRRLNISVINKSMQLVQEIDISNLYALEYASNSNNWLSKNLC